jgi:hypothetical protein
MDWVEHLGGLLERCAVLRSAPRPLFWNTLVCNTYLASHSAPVDTAALRACLGGLLRSHASTHAAGGLRQMLEVVEMSDEAESTK